VQDDLNWLGQLVKQSPEFKGFLNNISIQKTKQKEVVDSIISNTFSTTTK
jgi:F0F1-type ATP synthase delta subunit